MALLRDLEGVLYQGRRRPPGRGHKANGRPETGRPLPRSWLPSRSAQPEVKSGRGASDFTTRQSMPRLESSPQSCLAEALALGCVRRR